MITIVIAYVPGTVDVMRACLEGIKRHTVFEDFHVNVVCAGHPDEPYMKLRDEYKSDLMGITVGFDLGSEAKSSRQHGLLLNAMVSYPYNGEFLLTMDSDCIPIAPGWLSELHRTIMKDENTGTAGILHPWGPPPDSLSKTAIEWRVRKQHCWKTTHVACQLIRTADAKRLMEAGFGYDVGDDTGLGMVAQLKEEGRECYGYLPTRCPKSAVEFDAEFNRYSCVVFGDKVVHLGGTSRISMGDEDVFEKAFGWARPKIISEGGEFLLKDPSSSYEYSLDREEDVSKEKMQRLFGLHADRMKA